MKSIKGYEGRYSVTDDGRIWSHDRKVKTWYGERKVRGRWMATSARGPSFYVYVDLSKGKRQMQTHLVHILVLAAFGPKKPSKRHQVNHKDGNKQNNHISNLEWMLPVENNEHKRDVLNHQPHGMTHVAAKLTDDDVRFIRASSMKRKDLARMFGIHPWNVWRICSRTGWKHIA